MIKPEFVTFTGVDDHTDLEGMQSLSSRYPIEWGMLLGGSLLGNRYPKNLMRFRSLSVTMSLHLCGAYAKGALHNMSDYEASIADISYLARVRGKEDTIFNRVQVNSGKYDIPSLIRYQQYIGKPVVMQTRGKAFQPPMEGIQFLFDQSGGKGKLPKAWPVQAPDAPMVGYAGGIGPDNVAKVLASIDAHSFWIDMESNIRTDDWLDLNKCEESL